jgi:alkanesulfonate monooxygenase SsuD/methylene tetrahydromethanopterin reductase-like flavin-dependent oxidoreductase (luciferase family)
MWPMKIDIMLEPDLNPEQVSALAQLAESYGLRALWVQNYVASRDPFMCLVPAALATKKILLGVVVVSPYEMHPMKIGNALFTLNEFCTGRAAVVVGGGGYWCGRMGIRAERMVRAIRESIEIIKGASPEAPLRYQGELYNAYGYHPDWATDTPPRVYAGASREQMLRMSARVADGVMMSDVTRQSIGQAVDTVSGALKDNNRPESGFSISNGLAFHIKKDRQTAIREARRELLIRGLLDEWYLRTFLSEADFRIVESKMASFYKAYRNRTHEIEDVPETILDALVDNLTFSGNLDDLEKKLPELEVFKAAGLTELVFRLHDDPADAARIIGERIAVI